MSTPRRDYPVLTSKNPLRRYSTSVTRDLSRWIHRLARHLLPRAPLKESRLLMLHRVLLPLSLLLEEMNLDQHALLGRHDGKFAYT